MMMLATAPARSTDPTIAPTAHIGIHNTPIKLKPGWFGDPEVKTENCGVPVTSILRMDVAADALVRIGLRLFRTEFSTAASSVSTEKTSSTDAGSTLRPTLSADTPAWSAKLAMSSDRAVVPSAKSSWLPAHVMLT
jgi:hypothetical protein